MSKSLIVVVCHFKENIEWLSQLKHPYVVYNKNPKNADKFEHNLPNFGFDSIAYLRYIIDNYNNLPDYVCVCQDNPFPHCPPFIEKVNKFDFSSDFLPLGITYVRDNEAIFNSAMNYAKQNGIKVDLPMKFASGLQYIISKDLILKNDVKFYESLINTLPTNVVISETNYNLEYLWPSIFHFNSRLEVGRNGCM